MMKELNTSILSFQEMEHLFETVHNDLSLIQKEIEECFQVSCNEELYRNLRTAINVLYDLYFKEHLHYLDELNNLELSNPSYTSRLVYLYKQMSAFKNTLPHMASEYLTHFAVNNPHKGVYICMVEDELLERYVHFFNLHRCELELFYGKAMLIDNTSIRNCIVSIKECWYELNSCNFYYDVCGNIVSADGDNSIYDVQNKLDTFTNQLLNLLSK